MIRTLISILSGLALGASAATNTNTVVIARAASEAYVTNRVAAAVQAHAADTNLHMTASDRLRLAGSAQLADLAGWEHGSHAGLATWQGVTNIVGAAIAMIPPATNRVTAIYNPTNANEFTDGARRVWRISTATNTFIGWSVIIPTNIVILGETIHPSTNQWPGIPYPLWTNSALSYTQFITNCPAGTTQPMIVWYYYATGSQAPNEIYFSSPAEESGAIWFSNYPNSEATNRWRFLPGDDDADSYSHVYLSYGTNTTVSVVTSHVDTVAWQSDLSAVPRAPTNSVAGWLLRDTGSNVWLTVTVSNLSFKVWEVSQ